MPHLLIAGTTGSGKSVLINSIIAALLLQNTPDDLRFLMVDPKRVRLTGYGGIPHLLSKVVVEMGSGWTSALQWVLREMDGRYRRFSEVRATHIRDYNERIAAQRGEKRLPYVVVVIDELADLMMMAPQGALHLPDCPDGAGNRHPPGDRDSAPQRGRRDRAESRRTFPRASPSTWLQRWTRG